MMLIKKLFFFVLPIVFMFSCHKKPRGNNPSPPPASGCTTTANIQYSTCSAANGCTLSFSCPLTNEAHSFDIFPKFKNDLNSIFGISASAPINIASITVNSSALLASAGEVASTSWYNNPIDCTQDGSMVTCPNFLPIAGDFTITGTLGDKTLTVDVTVTNDVTPQSDCGAVICGGGGTTVQRMFDCSQRVTNYAGYEEKLSGTMHNFAPGDNPNPNWFLVSSPSASDNQQCFWLSPVMLSGNESVQSASGNERFDSLGNAMSTYVNGRLLWSGISSNQYDFVTANGNTPSNYDVYNAPGETAQGVIQNPPPRVRIATICQDSSSDPVRLGGDVYKWQMPSYPMLMTLTLNFSGCTPDLCNPLGFRATGFIPGFSESPSPNNTLWSSSAHDVLLRWLFDGHNGNVNDDFPNQSFGVRCVSAAW